MPSGLLSFQSYLSPIQTRVKADRNTLTNIFQSYLSPIQTLRAVIDAYEAIELSILP